MRMSKKEQEAQNKSLRGLSIRESFEIFRTAVTTVFKKAGKAMPQSISDDSEVIVKVAGRIKDPNKVFHYRNVIFDGRGTQNWYFNTDRDTISEWKRLYVVNDLMEELKTIKEKFEKEEISIEVRILHNHLQLN